MNKTTFPWCVQEEISLFKVWEGESEQITVEKVAQYPFRHSLLDSNVSVCLAMWCSCHVPAWGLLGPPRFKARLSCLGFGCGDHRY